MQRIPNFTLNTYTTIMQSPFANQDSISWIDFWEYIYALTPSYLMSYRDLDVRDLGNFLQQTPPVGNVNFAGQTITAARFLEYTKLGLPTLRTCNYFFRDVRNGSHG
ncbi:MAG: hypothetical protein H6765_03535 [Candidatus Peribacteria bacterium]|nr:MAG: hypothetical protein H6765_03535 [Candidatus Peribacteria bacterium]